MKQYATDMRTALADTLIELEGTNDRILWLDADLMASSGMNRFKAAYPDKVINCGIQEANMFGVAAGLSEEGFIPFVHSFGAFASRRIADQIFMSGVYARQDVRIVGSDPGISAGPNGGTHISLEDIGILRSLPGTIILEPCNPVQLRSVIAQTTSRGGFSISASCARQRTSSMKKALTSGLGKHPYCGRERTFPSSHAAPSASRKH